MLFLGNSVRSRSTFESLSKRGKIKKQYQCVSYNKVKTGVKRLLLYTKDERGGGGMGCSKGQVRERTNFKKRFLNILEKQSFTNIREL